MLLCFPRILFYQEEPSRNGSLERTSGTEEPPSIAGGRGAPLTIRKELIFSNPFKQTCVSIALLLFLLEQFVAGAGAGQEQPEVLGIKELGSDSSFPSRNFQKSLKEGGRHPLQPPTQTFLSSTLYCAGMKHMNS